MENKSSITELESDAIGEVMNISLGTSATALSALLGKTVEITIPIVSVVNSKNLGFDIFKPAIGVEIKYTEGLEGTNLMILLRNEAKAIIEILMCTEIPDEEFQLDELSTSALCEVMNQMMGTAATAMAEFLGKKSVNISTPNVYEISNESEYKHGNFSDTEVLISVKFSLCIGETLKLEFINILEMELAKKIISNFIEEHTFIY